MKPWVHGQLSDRDLKRVGKNISCFGGTGGIKLSKRERKTTCPQSNNRCSEYCTQTKFK